MTPSEFFENIKETYSGKDLEQIKSALVWAEDCHADDVRLSGEPYITHPIAVAKFLTDLRLDADTISAALLHSVIERCGVTEDEILEKFNETVAFLVLGVAEIKDWTGRISIERQDFLNFRKLLLAASEDIRVLIIRLADRLHNVQTIEALLMQKRVVSLQKTMNLYVPLAEYIGMARWQQEMEDTVFRFLYPEEYEDMLVKYERARKDRQLALAEVNRKLEEEVAGVASGFRILSRWKGLYSTYKKIAKYKEEGKDAGENLERIADLNAFRIIVVPDAKECYKVLTALMQQWSLYSEYELVKDYISKPKPNGYRSIHIILEEQGKPFEVQIRTEEMHNYNEYGPASHIAYKLTGERFAKSTTKFDWIRRLVGWKEVDGVKHYQLRIFQDKIFVLTPETRVIELPKSATPVDFAYRIHTELGNRCVGAKVNGEQVSLSHILNSGDRVEIVIDKSRKYPSEEWLEFVKSDSAKSRIRSALREKRFDEYVESGRRRVQARLGDVGVKSFYDLDQSRVTEFLVKEDLNSIERMYARIGEGFLGAMKFVDFVTGKKDRPIRITSKKVAEDAEVAFGGETGITFQYARCCNPLVGDEIVGYPSIRGITVHRENCSQLTTLDQDRLIETEWTTDYGVQSVNVQIFVGDRIGMIAAITGTFAEYGINLGDFDTTNISDGNYRFDIIVRVTSRDKLENAISRIRKLEGLQKVVVL